MYLKQLYIQHKGWFLTVLLFIVLQLFINYKRGMVISPFYHYGMYSEVIPVQSTYKVPEVTVNGQLLRTEDFNAVQWDKIIQPVLLYNKQGYWNSYLFNDQVKRFTKATDSTVYTNNITPAQFSNWYKQRLQGILSYRVDSVQVLFHTFRYDSVFTPLQVQSLLP